MPAEQSIEAGLRAHLADLQAQLELASSREARDAAQITFLTAQVQRLQAAADAAAPRSWWRSRRR